MQVRNIFILSADSLRGDIYEDRAADIAEKIGGVNFTDAYATANATSHSIPALAAGVYRDSFSADFPDDIPTLAELLAVDFDCSLWTENAIFGPTRGYSRGFSVEESTESGWKQRAQSLISDFDSELIFNTARWGYFNILMPLQGLYSDNEYYPTADTHHSSVMDSFEASSIGGNFHWIHYMDTHHPFEPPESYFRECALNTDRSRSQLSGLSSKAIISNKGEDISAKDIEDIQEVYRACCEYWYDSVEDFIDELLSKNYYDPQKDIMILTSDHGEGFDVEKQGMLGHTPTPAFWDDLVQVPLIMSLPEWPEITVSEPVSLIDLMPTILHHAQLSVPETVEGRPAEAPDDMVRDHVYFGARGVDNYFRGVRRHDGWKLFGDRTRTESGVEFTTESTAANKRFALLTKATEGVEEVKFRRELDEKASPGGSLTEVYDDLKGVLESTRGEIATSFEDELSEEAKEQLRDLGYVDDISE